MAEQIVCSATSAVTGELARILFSGIVGRLDRRAAAADKKLRRLELLLIKIHSAVEASEKHAIENASLLQWRDKLKEAAAEGDEVLAGFRKRQRASTDAARGPGDDNARHQQEQERPSSSSTTTASAAAARNNAPSGSARSTHGATETRLFSTDEDMDRLNSVVERLEELSPEIGMFVKLLKLEILKPEQTTAENRGRKTKRARPDGSSMRHSSRAAHDLEISTPEQRSKENNESMWFANSRRPSASSGNWPAFKLFACSLNAGEPGIVALVPAPGTNKEEGSEESCRKTPMGETVDATTQEEQERSTLVDRLEEAFAAICRSVELADGRDLRDREWLARWASILREAKGQGRAVLGAISVRRGATVAVDAGACEEAAECDDDREESELGRFVCGMESLAGEVDYFAGLACLCPSY
nr:uncharacterized protein LOC117865554 [Setaria viridis]